MAVKKLLRYFVRKKIFGVLTILIAGLGNLILFSLIIYSLLFTTISDWEGPTGTGSLGFIVLICVSGAVVYLISRAYRKRSGIDLSRVYKAVPPE